MTHHVVSRKELLQELSLLVLDSLDDELVVTRDVENGAARAWIGQLDEGLVTERILAGERHGKNGDHCVPNVKLHRRSVSKVGF